MISVIAWVSVTAIVICILQWLLLFRRSQSTMGERVVFGVILLTATVLNILLLNDWLIQSPLVLLRTLFGPASQMLQQWGLVGKE